MRPRSNPFAADLTAEAEALLRLVHDRHDRCHLVGFLGHACSRGRPVTGLDEADLAAYEAALMEGGNTRPKQGARDAAHAWNRMARRPGWPDHKIEPKSNARPVAVRFDNLPKQLKADVSDYLNGLAQEDVFGETNGCALADATLRDRRGKICQLISLARCAGVDTARLRTLKVIVTEAVARQILVALWEKSGRKPNAHAANLARLLRLIAKHHVGAPAAVQEMIAKAESRLRPGRIGMTERNKRRLRQIIGDETTVRSLVQLPQNVLAGLDPSHPTLADALAVQSCLAIQIELQAPMRAKNLAGLDLAQHIDIVNAEACHIVIEAQEVKNDQTLDYELGPSFVRLLTLYRDVYRPLLAGNARTTALFISRTGRQKTPGQLGAQISNFLKARAGISMNIHLFRHFAGYMFLKNHPGEYEPVRQLLGHKSLRTTVSFYVGLEQEHSFKRYDAILQSYIDGSARDVAA